LFSRQDAKKLLDRVAAENPKVVEDLVPKLLPLATVQRVLQNLLRERVSIRDAVSILEALGEAAGTSRNPVLLTEYVRQTMRRSIVRPYLSPNGEMLAFFVDPQIEQTVEAAAEHTEHGSTCALHPNAIRDIAGKVSRTMGAPESPMVAICSSSARFFLRQLMEASQWNVFFLSHNEIPAGLKVHSLGVIQ
jgi:flagellar biosynthesis protein FlhA